MTPCQHCGARVDNGLAVCELCQRKARTILTYLPVYFHNLARWRPGRTTARQVPGSRVLYDGSFGRVGTGDRISDALDDTTRFLLAWARTFADTRRHSLMLDRLELARSEDRIDDSQVVAWICRAMDRHFHLVARHDLARNFLNKLDYHEDKLRGLTESLVPGWYAGACRHCGLPTYVVPGLTWVKCRAMLRVEDDDGRARMVDIGCGSTTYARDHLDVVLTEARDWVAPQRRIAEAIVALVDNEQSVPRLHERIKKWQQRGRIEGVWRTERTYTWDAERDVAVLVVRNVGHPRVRLGDVLDVLLAEGATRGGSDA